MLAGMPEIGPVTRAGLRCTVETLYGTYYRFCFWGECGPWRRDAYIQTICIYVDGDSSSHGVPPPPWLSVVSKPDINLLYREKVQTLAKALKNAVAVNISRVGDRFKIQISTGISDGNLAEFAHTLADLFDSSKDLTLYIPEGLTDTQLKLILGHEIAGHLGLLDDMRQAGNMSNLYNVNSELYSDINRLYDLNAGQHEYIGNHIDQFESILREAFPGESEDFYNYGKWGGGIFNSSAFDALPGGEKRDVRRYLKDNDLRD
jgi:hypothetical protein